MRTYGHWIDGAETPSPTSNSWTRRSPFDGVPVAEFARGGPDDVNAAVAAARLSFDTGVWQGMPGSARAGVLCRFADLLQVKIDELSVIEAEEAGKPLSIAKGEIGHGIGLIRYAASLAWNIPGKVVNSEGADKLGLIMHEPRGVIGMILPWNYPFVCLMMKLPFALAAGCSVVVKPSEFTSGTALVAAGIAIEAGIPSGVFNIVTGNGAEVGTAMTDHPDVDMISFTGSGIVGKQIMQRAANTFKCVALELGGKGANIIFADADIDAAVEGAVRGFTVNQGEECCAGSRLLVEASIRDKFLERLVERSQRIGIAHSMDQDAEMGPLIHEGHVERVLGFIESAKREGARLLTGGGRLPGESYAKGCYVSPTIFADVKPGTTIFRDEIFGPVVGVTTFASVEEAIALANNTFYGLANGVWTKNIDKALAVTRRLRSGVVYVNTYLQSLPQMPFGGVRQSGMGRENGVEGLLEFMEVKSAFLRLNTNFNVTQ